MIARAKGQPLVIVESDTVTNVAEMLEFCLAAIERTDVDPSTIRLHIPQDMRVAETTLADGCRAYDVLISSVA